MANNAKTAANNMNKSGRSYFFNLFCNRNVSNVGFATYMTIDDNIIAPGATKENNMFAFISSLFF